VDAGRIEIIRNPFNRKAFTDELGYLLRALLFPRTLLERQLV
jgi:hypothetical protein